MPDMDLQTIWSALLEVLSYPLDLVSVIFQSLSSHYAKLLKVINAGKIPGLGLIWDVAKWGLLLLLIFFLLLWLVRNTARHALESERLKKSYFFDLIMIVLTLFVYYALLAIGLYVFSNIIVPVFLEL
ncbi:MAG: hypothetical protein JW782_07560 [Candidatus Saganbacteria bacterium]|nr:hypothetical protein [Candidatus Saganbacteria bacterium]